MSDPESSRNPTWHGLHDGRMPRFPERLVRTVLANFGIDRPEHLTPWPYGPFDILARFPFRDKPHLLKGRHVEQRGEKSLFETHRIQQQLHDLGIPVAPLVPAPSGNTLLKGPDWEEKGEIYYEVQQVLPGAFFTPDLDSLYRAGSLLAAFHRAGEQIDTFLLNKSMYVQVFQQRRFQAQDRFRQQLDASGDLSSADRQWLAQSFSRRRDRAWRCHLSRGLVHGDMCANNLLVADGQLSIVDLDEIGLGERTADLVDLLHDLPERDRPAVESLLKGYRDGGGLLSEHDVQLLHDVLVCGTLGRQVQGEQPCRLGEALARFRFLLDF